MSVLEFKSKIGKQSIDIPKIIPTVLITADGIIASGDYKSIDSNIYDATYLLESINRELKDFEQGRTHSHETVRKLYEKYL
ncbi:MAG TPA: hypothetical protein VGK10_05250 [Prolixibacteraceae bacterium]|jgi:hypothetical protein